MAIKFFNLLAISSLAVAAAAASFGEHHGARALGNPHHNVARHHADLSAAQKRDNSKRCTPRPSTSGTPHAAATSAPTSSVAAATSSAAADTSSAAAATSTAKASSSAVATTTTSSAAAASSSSSSSSGCKVGLAWSNGEASLLSSFKTDKTCWVYDWQEDTEYGMNTDGMTFMPMLWGSKNADAFAKKVVKGFSWIAMGMNEPDISSQSNLSPEDGASMWKQYLAPLKNEGYQLVSPAPATGPTWLTNFKNACGDDCDWDYTACHVYTTTASNFQSAVSAYQVFNKPVMVTEYSCQDYSGNNQQCSSDQIWSFITSVNGWMNSQDWIAAYFYFAPMTAAELESNDINGANAFINDAANGLTSLGEWYINN